MLAFHVILNCYLLHFYVSSILTILKYNNRVLSQVRTLRILEEKIEPSGLEDYNILLVEHPPQRGSRTLIHPTRYYWVGTQLINHARL
jgi:hypothetical protein